MSERTWNGLCSECAHAEMSGCKMFGVWEEAKPRCDAGGNKQFFPAHCVRIKLNGQTTPESHGEYYDLTTAEDVYLKPGEYKRISLGVSMELPEGTYGVMVPRSSTFEKWGVIQANSVGIYENGYCGDDDIWFFPALAMRETMIPKGTRICQFTILQHPPRMRFIPVEFMEMPSRGGFGSTGE